MLGLKELGWKGIATVFVVALVAVAVAPKVFSWIKDARKKIESKI